MKKIIYNKTCRSALYSHQKFQLNLGKNLKSKYLRDFNEKIFDFYSQAFKPFPFLTHGHVQTIVGSLFSLPHQLSSKTYSAYLPDGDSITYEVSTPSCWKAENPTVVMIHGLCGSHRSPYIVRVAKKFDKRGIRTIRMNLRGCGSGRGRAKKMYHVDSSQDVWHGLKKIKNEMPDSPLIVVGFSLGGNILLKMAGDWGKEVGYLVDKVIALNPPIDLKKSAEQLSKYKLYERYFMFYLCSEMIALHRNSKKFRSIPRSMSLLEFDELFIAPQSGYSTAQEYYQASSSARLIPDIWVDSHIFFARDDPIVDCSVIKQIPIPKNVKLLITKKGGHLGYLGIPRKGKSFRWIDDALLSWVCF